ncbi:hypothetical protein Droror1_Dr00012146 [Drosera rotundifolia]
MNSAGTQSLPGVAVFHKHWLSGPLVVDDISSGQDCDFDWGDAAALQGKQGRQRRHGEMTMAHLRDGGAVVFPPYGGGSARDALGETPRLQGRPASAGGLSGERTEAMVHKQTMAVGERDQLCSRSSTVWNPGSWRGCPRIELSSSGARKQGGGAADKERGDSDEG